MNSIIEAKINATAHVLEQEGITKEQYTIRHNPDNTQGAAISFTAEAHGVPITAFLLIFENVNATAVQVYVNEESVKENEKALHKLINTFNYRSNGYASYCYDPQMQCVMLRTAAPGTVGTFNPSEYVDTLIDNMNTFVVDYLPELLDCVVCEKLPTIQGDMCIEKGTAIKIKEQGQ